MVVDTKTAKPDVPADANDHCPGTESEQAGQASACAGCPNQQICQTAPKGPVVDPDVDAIARRLGGVKHKILVLSGKGGVGKSTFSSQLAFALAATQDCQVGLLDIDICGPSIPRMLGLEGEEIHQSASGWSPVYVQDNLGVMSIGFMLPSKDEAVVWRGPRKNGLIKQFLKDVDWGELDYLVVDSPPGTSDEHISIAQYLKATGVDGAVIITTPQEVSLLDVRKEISFCRKVGIPVLGVVENMSQLAVPLADVSFRLDSSACSPRDINEMRTNLHNLLASSRGREAFRNGNGPALADNLPIGVASESDNSTEALRATESGEVDITATLQQLLTLVLPMGLPLNSVTACTNMFPVQNGGASAMASQMGVPFLGQIPFDPKLGEAAESGQSILDLSANSSVSRALKQVIKTITSIINSG